MLFRQSNIFLVLKINDLERNKSYTLHQEKTVIFLFVVLSLKFSVAILAIRMNKCRSQAFPHVHTTFCIQLLSLY